MLEEVMERLEAEAMPPLRQVAGAASLAELEGAPPKHLQPAAWVIPIAERGGANQVATGVSQRIAERVGIVLALGNLSDRRGEAAAITVETVKSAVRAALVGWQPTAGHTAFTFSQGRTVRIQNRVVWHLEEFETAHFQRSV